MGKKVDKGYGRLGSTAWQVWVVVSGRWQVVGKGSGRAGAGVVVGTRRQVCRQKRTQKSEKGRKASVSEKGVGVGGKG